MDLESWSLDREIVLSRVIDAPPVVAYGAWTDADRFASWFGPDGFSTTVREMDPRVGHCTKFDMVAPDGTIFTNRFQYLDVVPHERLVMDHGSDQDNSPDRFRVTVTFDAQDNGKTVVTLRQLHQTAEMRTQVVSFGAVELGFQTLNKLNDHCAAMTK